MAAPIALRAMLGKLAARLEPSSAAVGVIQTPDGVLIMRSEDEADIVPLLAAALVMALDREAELLDRARDMTAPEWRQVLFGP